MYTKFGLSDNFPIHMGEITCTSSDGHVRDSPVT